MRLSFPPAPSYYAASVARLGDRAPHESLRGEHPFRCGGARRRHRRLFCGAAFGETRLQGGAARGHVVGYGASGRSGGQTIFGLAVGQQKLEREVGRDDARRLFDLSIEALDLTQSLIREYAIDCDYRPNHVHVAVKPRHVRELDAMGRASCTRTTAIRSARLLNRDELRDHVRSDRYLGGLHRLRAAGIFSR